MLPLLYKDGLNMAYACTSVIFLMLVLYHYKINESDRQFAFMPTFKPLLKLIFKSECDCMANIYKYSLIIKVILNNFE
jgi:hypothetical protein